jgi:hypothetical protein
MWLRSFGVLVCVGRKAEDENGILCPILTDFAQKIKTAHLPGYKVEPCRSQGFSRFEVLYDASRPAKASIPEDLALWHPAQNVL